MEVLPSIHRILAPHQDRYLFQHIIINEEVMIFIDAGVSTTPKEILIPYLKKHDLEKGQRKYLIITHSDSDHCGGTNELKRIYPDLIIIAGLKERKLLEDKDFNLANRYLEFQKEGITRSVQIIENISTNLGDTFLIDIGMSELDTIKIDDDTDLRIIETFGHTVGHISVYIEKLKCLIMTDALNGDGVYSISGEKVLCPTYRYTSRYLETIEKIKSLDVEFMYGSHYEAFQGKKQIDKFINLSKKYVERVEQYILDSLTGNEKKSLADLIDSAGLELVPKDRKTDFYYSLQGGLEYLLERNIIQFENINHKVYWYKNQ